MPSTQQSPGLAPPQGYSPQMPAPNYSPAALHAAGNMDPGVWKELTGTMDNMPTVEPTPGMVAGIKAANAGGFSHDFNRHPEFDTGDTSLNQSASPQQWTAAAAQGMQQPGLQPPPGRDMTAGRAALGLPPSPGMNPGMNPGMSNFSLLHGGLPAHQLDPQLGARADQFLGQTAPGQPLRPQEQAAAAGLAPGQLFPRDMPNTTGAWGSPLPGTAGSQFGSSVAAGPSQWSAANQAKLAGLDHGMSTARGASIDHANKSLHQLEDQHNAAFALTRLGLPGPVANAIAHGSIDPQQASAIIEHQRAMQFTTAERDIGQRGIGQRGVQAQGLGGRGQWQQDAEARREMIRGDMAAKLGAGGMKPEDVAAHIKAAGFAEEDDHKQDAAVPFVNNRAGLNPPAGPTQAPLTSPDQQRQQQATAQATEQSLNNAAWSADEIAYANQRKSDPAFAALPPDQQVTMVRAEIAKRKSTMQQQKDDFIKRNQSAASDRGFVPQIGLGLP